MAFNGSGIYELPVTTVTPAVTSTTIDSADFNTFTADVETALTLCVAKDGQTVNPRLNSPYFNEAVAMTKTSSEVNDLLEKSGGTMSGDLTITSGGSPEYILTPTSDTGLPSFVATDSSAVDRALFFLHSTSGDVYLRRNDSLGAIETDLILTDDGNVTVSGSAPTAAAQLTRMDFVESGVSDLSNKTLISPVISIGVSGTAFLDEDDMASNSATKLASQQSIKAYVDTKLTILDTPIELLNTSSPATSNTAVGSVTLDSAGAIAALVQVTAKAESSSSGSLAVFAASSNKSFSSNLYRKALATSVNNDVEYDSAEFTVNLDGNNDFWYDTTDTTGTSSSLTFELIGYYV